MGAIEEQDISDRKDGGDAGLRLSTLRLEEWLSRDTEHIIWGYFCF